MRPKTLKSILKVGRTVRMIFSPVSFVTNHARLKKNNPDTAEPNFAMLVLNHIFCVKFEPKPSQSTTFCSSNPTLVLPQTLLKLHPHMFTVFYCYMWVKSPSLKPKSRRSPSPFPLAKLRDLPGNLPQISTILGFFVGSSSRPPGSARSIPEAGLAGSKHLRQQGLCGFQLSARQLKFWAWKSHQTGGILMNDDGISNKILEKRLGEAWSELVSYVKQTKWIQSGISVDKLGKNQANTGNGLLNLT